MKKKLLLIVTCAIVMFTGCSSSEEETIQKNENVKIEVNDNEKLLVEKIVNANNEVIFTITNKTNEIVDYLNIDAAFYNKKGKLIRTEKQFIKNLSAKGTAIIEMTLANGIDTNLPSKIEIALNPTIYETKFETIYTNKVSGTITKSETEGQLNLNLTNSSGETIDELSAVVVFYKNKKIVDTYPVSVQNLEKTTQQIVYIPMISKNDVSTYVEYDDTKVIINNASLYNKN